MTNDAPRFCLYEFERILRKGSYSPSQAAEIISEHKNELFHAIRLSVGDVVPVKETISYRKANDVTERFPEPRVGEVAWMQSVGASLGIGVRRAALLLRDFLTFSYGTGIGEILQRSSNLADQAPRHLVEGFYRKETQAAFASLTLILSHSKVRNRHPWGQVCKAFIAENWSALKETVVSSSLAVLQWSHDAPEGHEEGNMKVEARWVIETLFALTTVEALEVDEVVTILGGLEHGLKHCESRAGQVNLSEGPFSFFGDMPATAMFVAALNQSGHQTVDSLWGAQSPSLVTPGPQSEILRAFQRSGSRLSDLLKKLHDMRCAEVALLSFSWSSTLNACFQDSEACQGEEVQGLDPQVHVFFSISCGALSLAQHLLTLELGMLPELEQDLMDSYLHDVLAFLNAFPPRHLGVSHVELVVRLTSELLSRSTAQTKLTTADSLWGRDADHASLLKGSVVLNLGCGLFPYSFSPLITLLSSLANSRRSAAHITNYLEHRLSTMSEVPDDYRELLVPVTASENDVWDSLTELHGPDAHHAADMLETLSVGQGHATFVQAVQDIAGGSHRPSLPRGTVGIADERLSVVSWITPWNGFAAICHVLKVLLRVACGQASVETACTATTSLFPEAVDAMTLIECLSDSGSPTLQKHLAREYELVSLLSRTLVELYNSARARAASKIPKEWLKILILACSKCLSSVVGGCEDLAVQAMEHLEVSSDEIPFRDALSVTGQATILSLSALLRPATLLFDGSVHLSKLSCGRRRVTSYPADTSDAELASLARKGFSGKINKFLLDEALPRWMSGSTADLGDLDSRATYWLLPACSLHFFGHQTSVIWESHTVCSVLGEVFLAASHPREPNAQDVFLFPALVAGLTACVSALGTRMIYLRQRDRSVKKDHGSVPSQAVELTALDEVMLRSDVVRALAVIASGSSGLLQHFQLYTAWSRSQFRNFVFDIVQNVPDTSWHGLDPYPVFGNSVHDWLADLAASCLAGHFACLAQRSRGPGPVQVPWPATRSGMAKGVPESGLNKGFTRRIAEKKSIAVLEMMIAAIACGQRAAARSLMGPRLCSGRTVAEPLAETSSEGESTRVRAEVTGSPPQSYDIISAVITNLRESAAECGRLLHSSMESAENREDRSKFQCLSLSVEVSVRFLRVGWESQSGRWFKESCPALDIWDVLSKLVRCDGSGSGATPQIDLRKISTVAQPACASMSPNGLGTGACPRDRGRARCTNCDVMSMWKRIAANVFRLFVAEIMSLVSEAFVLPDDEQVTAVVAGRSAGKLPKSLFQTRVFREFTTAFSERWMHVLLRPEDLYFAYSNFARNDANRELPQRFYPPFELEMERISGVVQSLLKTNSKLEAEPLLARFCHPQDIRVFGSNYAYDLQSLKSYMERRGVDVDSIRGVIGDVERLNTSLGCRDAFVEVLTSFSIMSSTALFVDSLAPDGSCPLTYSSPQYGGKLCRFLCRLLMYVLDLIATPSHAISIALEVSKLVSSLAVRLSKDELDQPALTSVRFPECPNELKARCRMTPLAQLCSFVDACVAQVRTASRPSTSTYLADVIRWLLLASSRLAHGSAFRDPSDLRVLVRSGLSALRIANGFPELHAAVSVALSASIENLSEQEVSTAFDVATLNSIFTAIDSLATRPSGSSSLLAPEAAASFLLLIGRVLEIGKTGQSLTERVPLSNLNSSGVRGLLPRDQEAIPSYNGNSDSRDPSHILWCSYLHLTSTIAAKPTKSRNGFGERMVQHALEFCSHNVRRMVRDSLDMTGDWSGSGRVPRDSEARENFDISWMDCRQLTIARVEESELATAALSRLSTYACRINEVLPELSKSIVEELCSYSSHVLRILRSEPVERWVRPVTHCEKERSRVVRLGSSIVDAGSASGTLAWSKSPSNSSHAAVSPSTPKRSPSQALKAAIGGRAHFGSVPPSPGYSGTPLSSPMPNISRPQRATALVSPMSPWGPFSSGLITSTDSDFGEEVSLALLRGLCSALNSLRHFMSELDILPFSSSLVSSDDPPGLGVLLSVQNYACGEIQRGADGERREWLHAVADTAMHLTLTHAVAYSTRDCFSQNAKDEVRKRMSIVTARMRRVVPPLPPPSLLTDTEVAQFWRHFR